ncbi:MAG: triose-phosphate isomerase [Proteobacteria bacterium]|nr:triose-phosphate isomerase [Pseudomonadota bacterium]
MSELLATIDSSCLDPAIEIAVCPTSLHIAEVVEQLSRSSKNSRIAVGAQNVCDAEAGAFTGEVSAQMLAEFGVRYALVGHSERRELYGESDQLVAAKTAATISSGLTPVVCLGETLAQRQEGKTEFVVLRQLNAVVQQIGIEGIEKCIVAYEPVWSIGTGETASPAQAQEVHAAIRNRLQQLDAALAKTTPILYGGSVKASNAAELFAQPDIDGGLVGGASLEAEEFNAICASA